MYAMCVSITDRPWLVKCFTLLWEMRGNGRSLSCLFQKIYYILELAFTYYCIKTVWALLSLRATTKTCNRNHLPAGGPSLVKATEQRRVRDVVNVCIFAWYCLLCLVLPSCSAFIGTSLQEKKSKADQNMLIVESWDWDLFESCLRLMSWF